MRVPTTIALSLALACSATMALAAEFKSGLQPGEHLPAYQVIKATGNSHDEVAEGTQLCYRCKLGNRPVVMIFARKADQNLANLVKQLDQVVAKNSDKQMASFVSLLGADADALNKSGKEFIATTKVDNVAVVVPQDQPNGPTDYKIDPQAEYTVLIYRDGTVAANHAVPAGGLNEAEIKAIVNDTNKILN